MPRATNSRFKHGTGGAFRKLITLGGRLGRADSDQVSRQLAETNQESTYNRRDTMDILQGYKPIISHEVTTSQTSPKPSLDETANSLSRRPSRAGPPPRRQPPPLPELSISRPPSESLPSNIRLTPSVILRNPILPLVTLPPVTPVPQPPIHARRLSAMIPSLSVTGQRDDGGSGECCEEDDGSEDESSDAHGGDDGESESSGGHSVYYDARTSIYSQTFELTDHRASVYLDARSSFSLTPSRIRESFEWEQAKLLGYPSTSQATLTPPSPTLNGATPGPGPCTSANMAARMIDGLPDDKDATIRFRDYFNSKSRENSPSETLPPAPLLVVPMPSPSTIRARPSVYHQVSKSMIDLAAPNLVSDTPSANKGKSPDRTTSPPLPLHRNSSMPTLSLSNEEPPPYPYPIGVPREDEGRETLPKYSNSIYLAALMPRKMEFSAPGVQAKDRRWKKVWCVLEGTGFKIYKVGTLEAKFGAPSAFKKGHRPATSLGSSTRLNIQPAAGSPRASTSSLPTAKSLDMDRTSVLNKSSPLPESTLRSSYSRPPSRASTRPRPSESSTFASTLSSSFSQTLPSMPTYSPSPSSLIRNYTLQRAESGLGTDYLKRANVIRVRMEGEQFLLQAPDLPAVVEWVEGFQAAANIALDLDERPMPRGAMFPRRRRRRRDQTGAVPSTTTPELPSTFTATSTNESINSTSTTTTTSRTTTTSAASRRTSITTTSIHSRSATPSSRL